MKSKISGSLKLRNSPFTVIITNEMPSGGVRFKEGRWGCVAAMMVAAISARPHIEKDLLSFTVPYRMFLEMESNVESSFLKQESWMKVRQRIE